MAREETQSKLRQQQRRTMERAEEFSAERSFSEVCTSSKYSKNSVSNLAHLSHTRNCPQKQGHILHESVCMTRSGTNNNALKIESAAYAVLVV